MNNELSRRERQTVDAVYTLGEATANEILEALPVELANPTVRTQLRILEQKGAVKHRCDGKRIVYRPVAPRKSAATSALRRVLDVVSRVRSKTPWRPI